MRRNEIKVGEKFSKLTVEKDLGKFLKPGTTIQRHYYLCKCDCGRGTTVDIGALHSGNTKTCGHCTSSGGSVKKYGRKLYQSYMDMRKRCYNQKANNYNHYGGRGIVVCEEWLDPNNGFENFAKWSIENGFSDGLSIDRINNDGNYSPNNCRWASKRIQNINKRPSRPNKSGYVGIRKHSSGRGWYGSVKIDNRDYFTGYSKDIREAAEMRNKFIIENGLDNQLNRAT